MNCKTCGGFVVAFLKEWKPGRCPHCGAFPPFELSAEAAGALGHDDRRRETAGQQARWSS